MSDPILPVGIESLAIYLEPVFWAVPGKTHVEAQLRIKVIVNGREYNSTEVFRDLDDFKSRFDYYLEDAARYLKRVIRESGNQTDTRNGPFGANPAGRAPDGQS